MIYITGATGRLGNEVLRLVSKAIPLVRKKSNLRNEIVTDFSKSDLKKILKNANAVIHLAGSMDFLDHHRLWETNVKLTERIVDSLPKNAKIIFASSISVYGKNLNKNPADENTKINPDTPYAKSKYLAEEIVKKHKNHVILRIGTIYGKSFDDYYMVLRLIETGRMYILGEGKNKVSFVNVKNIARAIKNAIKKGRGLYVVSGEAKTQQEILGIASKYLKVNAPAQKAPVSFALMFAQAEEIKARIEKRKPKITQEHVLILSSNREFDCKRAEKELKFRPFGIEKGIREMVIDMKNHKK
ncbi:MAG: NAD-dependent epimerase/dehydratase family protein [Candidatus Micrarchaeia archaeon]